MFEFQQVLALKQQFSVGLTSMIRNVQELFSWECFLLCFGNARIGSGSYASDNQCFEAIQIRIRCQLDVRLIDLLVTI